MEVLSSAKNTILSGYPDFDAKYTYSNAADEAIDFQFFPLKPLFLQVNKKSGLELLQIKNVDNTGTEISRVKKMQIDNLYCTACPKQGHDEIALGLSNGVIKLLNYKTSEFTLKFSAENPQYSVIFLDFNASNEYLSSVQEDGVITLYGLKTKVKLETINDDNSFTLSRFHPTKKFHMAVTSFNGSVFVYDIQAKRKIFQSLDCHAAPCKDICMSPAQPDIMLSVGYDCIINIFDTRKKIQPQQIKHRHPLSTIAVSDCGNYTCVGNLKGELIAYDMRNLKTHLSSLAVHDSAVVRVGFIPVVNGFYENLNSLSLSHGNVDGKSEKIKSLANIEQNHQEKRDSFCDYLEFHSYKLKAVNRFSARRESFDWELLGKRNPDFTTDLQMNTTNRLSTEDQLNLDSKTRNFMDIISTNVIMQGEDRSQDDITDLNKTSFESISKKPIHCESLDRRLNYIVEEKEEDTRYSGSNDIPVRKFSDPLIKRDPKHPNQGECCDKENIMNLSNKELEGFLKLPDDRNSTPNNCKRSNEIKPLPNISNICAQELMSELKNMRSEMDTKFKQLESELKFNAECNKWSIFTQNFNLWRKQIDVSEEIRDSVECLLQADPFVIEFLRLQKENEQLKKALLERNKSK